MQKSVSILLLMIVSNLMIGCNSSPVPDLSGLQCIGIGLFGSEHNAVVTTSSRKLNKHFSRVSSFSQLNKNRNLRSSNFLKDNARSVRKQILSKPDCSSLFCSPEEQRALADESFDQDFYTRFLFESFAHIQKDSFESNCYEFNYRKLYKTGEKTEDGEDILSGYSSKVIVKLDGVKDCNFSTGTSSTLRDEQTVSHCSSNSSF